MSDRRFNVHWHDPTRKIQGVLANVPRHSLADALRDATRWASGKDAVAELTGYPVAELTGYHWEWPARWAVDELEHGSECEFGRVTIVYAPDDWTEWSVPA